MGFPYDRPFDIAVRDGGGQVINVKNKAYGAVGDGTTDDTAAIQAAINAAALANYVPVFLPVGRYLISGPLYFYYDATNNPDFPQGDYRDGRIELLGAKAGDWPSVFYNDLSLGTVIETSSTTQGAIIAGTGSGAGADTTRRIAIRNMTIIGATSAALVDLNAAPEHTRLENLTIWNSGANGDALHIRNGFYQGLVRNVHVAATGTAGVGLRCETAGLSHFEQVTATNCPGTGMIFGTTSSGTPTFGSANVFTAIQARNGGNGIHMMGVRSSIMNGVWIEKNTDDYDLKIDNHSTGVVVNGLHSVSTALSLANVVLGGNSGTAAQDAARRITFNEPNFSHVASGTYGLIVYGGCTGAVLNQPAFKNNGGVAVGVDDSGTVYPIEINNPDWYPSDAGSQFGIGNRVRSINNPAAGQRYLARIRSDDDRETLTGIASASVSNAADNGSGAIRITTSSAHGLSTGDYVRITSVGGTTEANGVWAVTVVDTTNFDLDGSTFSNAYTSGGFSVEFAADMGGLKLIPPALNTNTVGGSVYVRLPTDAQPGQTLTIRKSLAANTVGLHGTIDGTADTLITTTSATTYLTVYSVGDGEWVQV